MRDASEALVFYHATTAWAATFVVGEMLNLSLTIKINSIKFA